MRDGLAEPGRLPTGAAGIGAHCLLAGEPGSPVSGPAAACWPRCAQQLVGGRPPRSDCDSGSGSPLSHPRFEDLGRDAGRRLGTVPVTDWAGLGFTLMHPLSCKLSELQCDPELQIRALFAVDT